MPSDRKKSKRAKRAKFKAKQTRVVRPVINDDSETLDFIAQNMLRMMVKLGEAEEASMVEMLKTLMVETGRAEMPYLDDEIDSQIVVLRIYGGRTEGRLEDWMEQPDFLAAYAEAARWVGRSELIEAWQDAHALED